MSETAGLPLARRAYQKVIHRQIRMGHYRGFARDGIAPATPLAHRIVEWGPERFGELLGINPYLTESDVAHFRRQTTRCLVTLDGDMIAANSWRTSGRVYLAEIDDYVDVPPGSWYGARNWVRPEYRGQSLSHHMIHCFAQSVDPDVEFWAFIHYTNEFSIRSVALTGGALIGDLRVRWLFGRKTVRHQTFAPLSILDDDRIRVP